MPRTPPEIRHLYAALVLSWSDDTGHARYDELCPDLGQCCPTSLVVLDYLGGHVRQGWTKRGRTHYWNVLPDGRELDLARCQFDVLDDRVLRDGEVLDLTRDQALGRYRTEDKYKELAKRVYRWLKVIEKEEGKR